MDSSGKMWGGERLIPGFVHVLHERLNDLVMQEYF